MLPTVLIQIVATLLTRVTCTDQLPDPGSPIHLDVSMEEELSRTSPVVDLTALLRRNLPKSMQQHIPIHEAAIKFSFLEPHSKFLIDHSNRDAQLLRIHTRVDRESICPTGTGHCPISSDNHMTYDSQGQGTGSCMISVLLIAEIAHNHADTQASSQLIVQLNIRVLDINDNAPSWRAFASSLVNLQQQLNDSHQSYASLMSSSSSSSTTTTSAAMVPRMELKIPEHTAVGTRLAIPLAVDPDACPENTTAEYGIDSQTVMDAFVLDWVDQPIRDGSKSTGSGLWLRVNKDLNHDDHPVHQVIVFASDAGIPRRLTGHLLLNISITDVNDHPPKFSKPRDFIWVREHELIGTRIYQAQASDSDPSDRLRVTFGFLPSTTASSRALFKVNPQTGEVSVQGPIDFEQAYQHRLLLFVSDGKWTDEMELVILIVNLNDHAPEITLYSHLAAGSTSPKDAGLFHTTGSRGYIHAQLTVIVRENGPGNQLIATVTVTDSDVSAQLKAESAIASLWAESGLNKGAAEPTWKIAPMKKFEQLKPVCSVDNEQFVMEALQLDATQQPHDRFRFKISLAGRPLDREKQNRILLQIQCYDEDTLAEVSHYTGYLAPNTPHHQSNLYVPLGRRSSSASLLILVSDENDSPPVFVGPQLVKLAENAPVDTLVTRLHATDADDPHTVAGNAGLRYQLIDEPVVILTKKSTLTPGTGTKLSKLTNVEDSSVDGLPPRPWFHLNPTSGDLKTLVSFDRELVHSIVLPVQVTDGGDRNSAGAQTGQPNTVNGTVTIEIADVNDCLPTFTQPLYEFNLSEDARPPVRIGRVNVSDCDVDESNRLLEFWLQSSMPSKRGDSAIGDSRSWPPAPAPPGRNSPILHWFSVSKSGELFARVPHHTPTAASSGLVQSSAFDDLNSPLDRERNEIIVLDIYARDSGSPSLTGSAQILIRVLDVNDHAPEWEFPRPQHRLVNVSADAAVGNRVARLTALDPDEGPRGKITYTILSGNEAGQFELDSESGWIYLAQPIDGPTVFMDGLQTQSGTNHVKWPTRTGSMIRLYVQASDHGDPPRSSSSVLDIVVQRPPVQLAPVNNQMKARVGADSARHAGKQLDFRDTGSDASSAVLGEPHSDVYYDQDRPGRSGLLLSTDFLTLVAMITATLAALLLIFILFVVIRCRKLKQTQQCHEHQQLQQRQQRQAPVSHRDSQSKWYSPNNNNNNNSNNRHKRTAQARGVAHAASTRTRQAADYFSVCLGKARTGSGSCPSDRTPDKQSAILTDPYFSTHRSNSLSSRQPYTVTDPQGHCLTDLHSSDIIVYSTKGSLMSPCQTMSRAVGDPGLNANEYSFLVHSNCPVEEQSVCAGMLLNNNSRYKPQSFYPCVARELDFQLLPGRVPSPSGPGTPSTSPTDEEGKPIPDAKTGQRTGDQSERVRYLDSIGRSDKNQAESVYTALSSVRKASSKTELHSVCQSSSFV